MVLKKLTHLNQYKAPGVDNLNSTIFKEVALTIASPLSGIFFSKSQLGNYRPVSLTSQISKMMEPIIRDVVVEHLQIHNLIKTLQHGFMKRQSCLTYLLVYLDKITAVLTPVIDEGLPVDAIYLDFSKAFDWVPHCWLAMKLNTHGIGNRWITERLLGRVQRVVINGTSSRWSPVKSGVSQESVLGAILFVIYINDINEGVCNNILKFADDTKLFSWIASSKDAEVLQRNLNTMHRCNVEWLMLLNAEKCKCVHYGHNNRHYKYFMGEDHIQTSHEEKDLK